MPIGTGFLSKEILGLAIGLGGAGIVAWNDVTTDIAVIQNDQEHNKQEFHELKEGQKDIQKLLNRLLLEKSSENEETRTK